MKKFLCLIMAALMVALCLSSCGQGDGTVDNSSSSSSTSSKPTDTKFDCMFLEMPAKTTDFSEVFISGNVAIFTFVVAGMDVSSTELVTYDLLGDKLLGNLNFGEEEVTVFPTEKGEFAVFSKTGNTFSIYSSSCEKLSSKTVEAASEIAYVGYNGENLLLILMSGNVSVYNLSKNTVTDTGLAADSYQIIGDYGSNFLVESYEKGIISITNDGKTSELFAASSAQVVGNAYAAGVKGDYITLFSVLGGNPVMAPKKADGEIFCAADGAALLSHSQSMDMKDDIYFYCTDSMTVSKVAADGQVVDAAVYGKGVIAVTRANYGEILKFKYIDFSDKDFESINSHAYDDGILNGAEPLADPQGSSETVQLINRIQNDYGIRIVYEEDIFNFNNLGFTVTFTSEDKARNKAILLEELFEFLPEGLLKEMNQKRPVVIYLCEEIAPSAGGINTVLEGYNVTFLSVTGNDDYFLSVAAHEIAHAIEQGISSEILAGWCELMPQEAQNAYNNLSLTVEYTPDDKGKTPVWFIEAYSRSSEIEDRAVVFAEMFNAKKSGDYSLFDYEGINKKAEYWCEMLENVYTSCKDMGDFWK